MLCRLRRAGEVKEIPADLRLTKVKDLFISQATITGESAILEKNTQVLSYSNSESLTQLKNLPEPDL